MLTLAALSLTAALAAADEAATEAVPPADPAAQLAQALEAFDALETERARELLEPLVATPGLPDDIRARAWLALGLTRASLLDDSGARAAFAAALAIDRTLDVPAETSPKVRTLFERTRERLPPPAPRAPVPPAAIPRPAEDPAATAPPVEESAAWPLIVGGGALLAAGAVAGVGAAVADVTLGTPVAGRSRAEYDAVRGIGIAALASAVVLSASGALALGAALLDEGGA